MRKNVLKPYKLFNAADMSTTQTSPATNTENLDKASIIVRWSGTSPVGVITVEGKNKVQTANGMVDSDWVVLDFEPINVTGNSGNHTILFIELPFTELRLVYTATSGTGAITAVITAKQIGG